MWNTFSFYVFFLSQHKNKSVDSLFHARENETIYQKKLNSLLRFLHSF